MELLFRPTDWESVIVSLVITTKNGKATDSWFAIVGAHHCRTLMDVLECLPAYVSTTSTRLVLSTESGKKAIVNGLVLDCRGDWRVAHSGVEILEWLITGCINCQFHLQL